MKQTCAALVLIGCAITACASAPTQNYSGPERPAAEVSVLKSRTSAKVLAIDGTAVSGTAWSLLPGNHQAWLRVRVYTNAPNVNWTIYSFCQVQFHMAAGQTYKSRVRIVKERAEGASGLAEKVKMEVGIADEAENTIATANFCVKKRPRFKV